MLNRIETEGKKEQRRTASFRLVVNPERIPWILAASARQPQVELYSGEFPEPFTDLTHSVSRNQDEVIFTAVLGVGPDFNARYADSIGSSDDLANTLLRRYPQSKFQSPQALVVYKGDRPHAVIQELRMKIVRKIRLLFRWADKRENYHCQKKIQSMIYQDI